MRSTSDEPCHARPGGLQVGGGVAGMGGDADRTGARRLEPALQLVGEEQVGELALAVGRPLAVAALPLQVVEVDAADAVGAAAHRHDARARASPAGGSSSRPVRAKWPRWLVPSCISKPSAVLRYGSAITPALLSRTSSAGGRRAAPSAARRMSAEARRGRAPPAPSLARGWAAADLPLGGAPFVLIAAGEHDVRTVAGQRQRRLVAEPAVGAGDDDGLAAEVGEVGRGPMWHAGRCSGYQGSRHEPA